MKRNLAYVVMGNDVIMNNIISNVRKDSDYIAPVRGGKCVICSMIESIGAYNRGYGKGANRIETPSHVRGVFFCDYHFRDIDNCLMNYGCEYFITSGKPTAKSISQSIEFETVHNTYKAVATMCADLHFLPTADCTVEIEYKSPIYLSLQGFTKAVGNIEDMINKLYFDVDRTCGTHLHTSIYDGIDHNNKPIPKYDYTDLSDCDIYEPLFFPMCQYLDNMDDIKLELYFGSDFRRYAVNPIHERHRDYSGLHESIFNVQHTYSLEFRLPRFSTAEKYRKIALFMQEVVTNIAYFQDGTKTAEMVGKMNLKTIERYFPM